MTLPEFTIFSRKQGCGYIVNEYWHIDRHMVKIPVSIAGEILHPGQLTTLRGYFCRELRYAGMMNENEMIFFIGATDDLFEKKYYFQCVFKIQEDRIFELFAPGSGRDHYYINGKWK